MSERKKIAAIITTYFPRSHADVVATKYMKGFPTNEGFRHPRVKLISIYLDQIDPRDIGRELAEAHSVPIYPSIRSALTLGGNELAVDGVLLIGEHGDYPYNELEQHMYPRRYLFEQICGVFASSGRSVPAFCDKHLSYNWTDAKWMYDRAQELNVPFMAGSSLPTCWRNPFLEYDLDTPLEAAIGIGYGGIESYGFHALETLQCMIERRAGGESGVVAVQCLEGEAVWEAGAKGLWSRELAEAACAPIEDKPDGRMEEHCKNPAVFLIEHSDGFTSAVLMLNGYTSHFAYAGQVNGEIQGTEFYLQGGDPHSHFSYLGLNIEEMFLTGLPQYPVERTLLTTGVLDAAMRSRSQGHIRLETPYLASLAYRSYEKLPIRPTAPRPGGSTLDPWPPDSPDS
ncbi:MAG: hypothetical protein O7E52_29350 [Candidatus Poribacteria bacterium]|nr:hypothetical protein [Candidatus Poribacteria bacterium]